MKFGIIADLHLREADLASRKETLKQTFREMRLAGCEWVLNCGDTINVAETMKRISLGDLVAAYLEEFHLPQIIIEGNHDLKDPLGMSGLEVFRCHPQIRIVAYNKIEAFDIGDCRIVAMPWQDHLRSLKAGIVDDPRASVEACKASIKAFTANHPKAILIGHCGVVNASGDSGFILNKSHWGEAWSVDDFKELNCKQVFLGHYHKAQEFPGNVRFCGQIQQNCFGEASNWTGYWIYDSVTNQATPHFLNSPAFLKLYADEAFDYKPKPVQIAAPKHKYHTLDWVRTTDKLKVRVEGEVTLEAIKPLKQLFPTVEVRAARKTEIHMRTSAVNETLSFREQVDVWAKANDCNPVKWTNPIATKWESRFEELENSLGALGKLESIQKLTLENIGPHKRTVVNFKEGYNCIIGPNGSGKSFLLEATFAAIYGVWISEGRVWTKGSKLILEFTAEGKKWQVTREPLTESRKIFIGEWINGDWELMFGGKSKLTEGNAFLTKLVGAKALLRGCCYLEQFPQDIIGESSDTTRMIWMRDWLGFGSYDIVNSEIKKAKAPLASLIPKINDLYDELSKLREKLKKANGDEAESRAQLGVIELEFKSTNEELSVVSKELTELKTQQYLYLQQQEQRKAIEDYKKTVELSREEQDKLVARLKHSNEEIESLEGYSDRPKYLNFIEQLPKLETDTCDLQNAGCRDKPIPCIFIEKAVEAKRKMAVIKGEMSLLNWSAESEEYHKSLDYSRNQLALQVSSQAAKQLQSEKTIEMLEAALIKEIKEVKKTNISKLETKVAGLEADRARLQASLVNYSKTHAVASAEQARINGEIELIQTKKLPDLEQHLEEVETLATLEAATSPRGIVQDLIATALPTIQKQMEQLAEAVDLPFNVSLQTQRLQGNGDLKETFQLIFTKLDGSGSYDVRSTSGGERAVVRLLWRLSIVLSRADGRYQVLLLDEPTAANDKDFTEAVMQLLEYTKQQFSQIILVTHDSDLSSKIDNQIVLKVG